MTRTAFFTLLTALALAPLPVRAQADSAPLPRVALKPIKFVAYDLPNGLHVILHQKQSSSTAIYLERPSHPGDFHFTRGQISKCSTA